MRRAPVLVSVVALLLAGGLSLGAWLGPSLDRTINKPPPPSVIDEVRRELAKRYYTPVSAEVLALPTLELILKGLDPFTEYLSPQAYEKLQVQMSGRYSGLGIVVDRVRQGLRVRSSLPGPARSAGIRAGDLIVRIDGRLTKRLRFGRLLALMHGQAGTSVELSLMRTGAAVRTVKVTRAPVSLPAVRFRAVRVAKTKLAYVRVLSFSDGVSGHLGQVAMRLASRGVRGLILDLRGNPGGLVEEAVGTVSTFLDRGVVCTIQRRGRSTVYRVSGQTVLAGLPLAVLVDDRTASAGEIVAAALGENRRAIVVGTRTYGKGSLQSIRPLSDGGALKLTTAVYRTPGGRDLTGTGLKPMVVAVDSPVTVPDEVVVAAERALLGALLATR